ncbi:MULTISPECIES: isoprenylcysteine carboxyl methyltransferase family protein [unclassified Sinorhizobium]|uniref:isoprenylcysteine carboxyl methyltransferase family protein n=1 Tax=unclassified Sinorhizobium TaxID=2613772 RepID=UPI0035244558
MGASIALMIFVTLQRLSELVLSRRNTSALLKKGAYEVASEHYPYIVALHAAWLAGLWLLAPGQPVNLIWLTVFVVLQGLRAWVLLTLGKHWTTRIIVLPGAPLVTSGPYRFMHHPNYAVVVGEIAVLPLVFGLPFYAIVFSVLNATILTIRIRAENDALRKTMILK